MKSILIIGMGRFGHLLAMDFTENGHDVMVIDEDEAKVTDLVPYVTSTRIGDCTREDVLKNIGISNFDLVFVCIGTNFQSSLEITSLAKELGAKRVISKATRDVQAKFLLKNGADEVIYPDRDIAYKISERFSVDNAFDYIDLPGEIGVYEMLPLPEWIGKSVKQVNVSVNYHVTILGIKNEKDTFMRMLPSADYVFNIHEHIMVMSGNDNAEKLLKGAIKKTNSSKKKR